MENITNCVLQESSEDPKCPSSLEGRLELPDIWKLIKKTFKRREVETTRTTYKCYQYFHILNVFGKEKHTS